MTITTADLLEKFQPIEKLARLDRNPDALNSYCALSEAEVPKILKREGITDETGIDDIKDLYVSYAIYRFLVDNNSGGDPLVSYLAFWEREYKGILRAVRNEATGNPVINNSGVIFVG